MFYTWNKYNIVIQLFLNLKKRIETSPRNRVLWKEWDFRAIEIYIQFLPSSFLRLIFLTCKTGNLMPISLGFKEDFKSFIYSEELSSKFSLKGKRYDYCPKKSHLIH